MLNTKRLKEIKDFLKEKGGLKNYQILDMGVDASSRKYYRIALSDGTTRVLLDDEGCFNRPKEFAEIASFLLKHGIRAPKIFARQLKKGLMLIEDFGETDFVKKANGQNDTDLLRKAVDVLVKLHKVKEFPACAPQMDEKVIKDNFALFCDWYVPACLGRQLTKEERKGFFAAVEKGLLSVQKMPKTLVLWDYHVNNVMYPDDSDEAAIIDFQDAYVGPGLYDLASLIEDERRHIDPAVTEEMKNYYFEQMGSLNRKEFEEAYAYMALLRHLRVLGRFTTLITVKNRPWYATYIPHGLELVERSLTNPMFRELKQWMDQVFDKKFWGIPVYKNISKAFVLAAGRGTRMRELTDNCAKPMVEVAGRRLMDYGTDLLKNAQIKDVVINVCYKKAGVKAHLKKLPYFNFTVSEEKEALETGGGIKKALRFFGDKPFVVVNADNILIDDGYKPIVRQMMDVWDDKKYDMLLLLRSIRGIHGDTPQRGDYKIADGRIYRNKDKVVGEGFDFGYVGVAVVHPRVFRESPRGKFSLVKLFDKAESEGRLGFALSDREEFWVGSPEALRETEDILNKKK